MRDTHRERGRDTGRGRSRLHAGSLLWDLITSLQDHALGWTWCKTDEPPMLPKHWCFLMWISLKITMTWYCWIPSSARNKQLAKWQKCGFPNFAMWLPWKGSLLLNPWICHWKSSTCGVCLLFHAVENVSRGAGHCTHLHLQISNVVSKLFVDCHVNGRVI